MAKDEGLRLIAVATGDENTMDKDILEAVVSGTCRYPMWDDLSFFSYRLLSVTSFYGLV